MTWHILAYFGHGSGHLLLVTHLTKTNSVLLCTTLLPAKVRGYPNICHWVQRRGPSGGWETIASNEGPGQKRTKT